MDKPSSKSATRHNRVICVSFSPEIYNKTIESPTDFRAYLDEMIEQFPELFPSGIAQKYRMKDIYHSKKLAISIRRIEICKTSYTIRPSYVMPYMTGTTEEVEKPLFLRKFNVPFWGLSYVFGRVVLNK